MTSGRKLFLGTFAALLLYSVFFLAWQFLQIGRRAPDLAPEEQRATLIRVYKQARVMTLMHGNETLKTYQISLGSDPQGHKQQEGDGRTPEGLYTIDSRNARSHFHLALHISYPNDRDTAAARQHSVSPGGDIMIHGLPNGLGWLGTFHLNRDWTDGCVAVTNDEIEEIWRVVALGTPIEVTK